MISKEVSQTSQATRPGWVYYLVFLLLIEKIIQHVFVTLAFYFNWADIASTVVVSPMILMILGGLVAILFILSSWGMIKKRPWAINLVIALALFDMVGEFVAQGKIGISMTWSFLVATLLLALALTVRRQFARA